MNIPRNRSRDQRCCDATRTWVSTVCTGEGILGGFFCLSGVDCIFLIQYSIAWEKNSITKQNMFFVGLWAL